MEEKAVTAPSELEHGLDEFLELMRAKFYSPKVLAKQGRSRVTVDGNLDKMDPEAVFDHYQEEINGTA